MDSETKEGGGLEMYILSPPPLRVFNVCDNPLCVRAEAAAGSHLFLGDHSENMRERAARGRDNLHGLAFLHRSRAVWRRQAGLRMRHRVEVLNPQSEASSSKEEVWGEKSTSGFLTPYPFIVLGGTQDGALLIWNKAPIPCEVNDEHSPLRQPQR